MSVVLLLDRAGAKLKLIQALAPVLSTNTALFRPEGLDLVADQDAMIAGDSIRLAEFLRRSLSGEVLWEWSAAGSPATCERWLGPEVPPPKIPTVTSRLVPS